MIRWGRQYALHDGKFFAVHILFDTKNCENNSQRWLHYTEKKTVLSNNSFLFFCMDGKELCRLTH